jgi:hypothetical protein
MSKLTTFSFFQDMANVFYKFPKSPFVGFANPFFVTKLQKFAPKKH